MDISDNNGKVTNKQQEGLVEQKEKKCIRETPLRYATLPKMPPFPLHKYGIKS